MKIFLELINKIPVNALLLISAILVILGDFLGKYWSINRKPVLFVVAVGAYILSSFIYMPTLLREGLVITSIIWSLLSIIGFLLVGLLIFKESLTSGQIVGVVLGGVALIILTVTSK